MADESKEKIELLNTKVIAPGYDLSAFIAFLGEKKQPMGDDIDNWSLEEFKVQIEEFLKGANPQVEEDLVTGPDMLDKTNSKTLNSLPDLPANIGENSYHFYGSEFPSNINDRKKILKKLHQICEADRLSMNEYSLTAVPQFQSSPTELNREQGLKITVSE